jgi:hypothetical protein
MCFYVKSNYEATFRWSVINAFCLLPLFIDGITFDRVSSNRQFGSVKLQTTFMLGEMQTSLVLVMCKNVAGLFLTVFSRNKFACVSEITLTYVIV